jgi:hypothetical protein
LRNLGMTDKDKVCYHLLRPSQIIERRETCPIAYIHIGTLEWHGLHNPVGADTLQAEAMAVLCAQKGGLAVSDKFMHIRSDYNSPNFDNYTGSATLVISPSLMVDSENRVPDLSGDQYINMQDLVNLGDYWFMSGCDFDNGFCDGMDLTHGGGVDYKELGMLGADWLTGNNMKDVMAAGGTPIDIAVGDYWVDNPGDEIAVIWDTPISNVDYTDYYTISIYDTNGIEINHCGRSTVKWAAIASGNFISLTGDEIAAVPSSAVGGVIIGIIGGGDTGGSGPPPGGGGGCL